MADESTLFTGLSAFPLTPASASGEVMVDEFGVLLERLENSAIDSVGVLGSTGAAAYLNRAQRRRAIKTAHDVLTKPVIAGVSALRTDQVLEHALDAKKAGADAILLSAMSYIPLNDREVVRLFERVNEAVALPICIYNNPGTTKFTFSPALIGELSQLEHVAAIKDSAGSSEELAARRAEILPLVDEDFVIGMSGDALAVEALIEGSGAWYSVLAGTLPDAGTALVKAIADGNHDVARRCDARLQPMWELMRRVGSIRVMYALVDLLGLSSALPPEPLLPLGYDEKAALILALEAGRLV
ncbi:dihydrodipicolinate synthase family protein [Parafrigoribacterium mesophilum]|uniref:dihydrodipicolinate synthase family protein n=1 Tax=Parafrigoribacterium mesophilum TaxID=433646 RepID=UPI0031FCF714